MASVTVNRGNQKGWGNLKFAINGNELTGITEIKYKDKTEKELLYGSGNQAIGVGIGNESYEASIKMYRYEIDKILAGITTGPKKLSALATMSLTVVAKFAASSAFETDVIQFQFTESGRDTKQGDKMDLVELPLLAVDIQYNV